MAVQPVIFVPAIIARRRRRLISKFEEAGAVHPDKARTLEELGVADSHMASQLKKSGVLVSADGTRFYLSADGFARWNKRHNAAALTAICVTTLAVLAVFAVAFFLSRR